MIDILIKSGLMPMDKSLFEVVERKGIGHPDTLADGIAESISLDYSNYCKQRFGVILHHNLDKIMLVGGLGKFGFGMGKMIKPWKLLLNGRLSQRFGSEKIDIKTIQVESAKKFLARTLPYLNLDKWLKIYFYTSTYSKNPVWFNPKTIDDIPDAKNPRANDTSIMTGHWPLSTTEKLTLSLEKYFYTDNGRPKFDYIGQDIKVMAVRKKQDLELTMCVPFICSKMKDYNFYKEKIEKIKKDLHVRATEKTNGNYNIKLFVNSQDEAIKKKEKGVGFYFVVSGSALDSGEEGAVGRGNKSRGVISSMRPYGMEAVCGKNPVYHVGKVYTYFVDFIAKEIAEKLKCEVSVILVSQNGNPLYEPHKIYIQTSEKRDNKMIKNIIFNELTKRRITDEIISKKPFLPFPGGGNGYREKG